MSDKRFVYWQWRTIFATMIGYAFFYFVRKNFSIAIATPEMGQELGWNNKQIGLIMTSFSLLYGVARFGNGVLADRINARKFMVFGLVCSALMNVFVGFTSSVVMLGVLWFANAWFQGMGFPPCARLLAHWVPPNELAMKQSVWNVSHSVGAALVVVFCSWIISLCSGGAIPQTVSVAGLEVALHPGWRWCFFLPAAVALAGAAGLWAALRDTPSSVGLPELGGTTPEREHVDRGAFWEYLKGHVFKNPTIWILCIANFFVYTVRFGVLDWGPKLLKESGGISLKTAAWMVAGFEVSGIIGMLSSGWVTDRVFGGRGPRTCAFCMGLCALFMLLFGLEWTSRAPNVLLAAVLLAGAGFFIYGPQALVGISAANVATKKAAATASGLTGTFGYASGLVSGGFIGWLMDTAGVVSVLGALVAFALAGLVSFLFAWRARAHGYDE